MASGKEGRAMTEAEWVACTVADQDTGAMWEYLRGKGSPRRLRLFACACCRRIELALTDPRSRRAVDVAEKFVDGSAPERELVTAWNNACWAADEIDDALPEEDDYSPAYYAALAAHYCAIPTVPKGDYAAEAAHAAFYALRAVETPGEAEAQGRLLCDILGRPASVVPNSFWLSHTVLALAQVIYDDRDFADLPVLADALADAGCTDAAILDHCRVTGPHTRGCWVVDLILGKS
jgi:hypothetical protein